MKKEYITAEDMVNGMSVFIIFTVLFLAIWISVLKIEIADTKGEPIDIARCRARLEELNSQKTYHRSLIDNLSNK